jgi:glycosyltransferase involved in cell wall biosynthesis
MKVLHCCTYDVGGAANAALGLHRGLQTIGVESRYLCSLNQSGSLDVEEVNGLTGRLGRKNAGRLQYWLGKLQAPFDSNVLPDCTIGGYARSSVERIKPDLINAHWLDHGFLTQKSLRQLNRPVVWTMHDMSPATGGFGYVICSGGEGAADSLIYQDSRHERSAKLARWKRDQLAEVNLTVVSPSHWLANIPYGVDSNLFRPVDPNEQRQRHGFDKDDIILFFGADTLESPRKGGHILVDALRGISLTSGLKVKVAYFGSDSMLLPSVGEIEFVNVGRFHSSSEMAEAYSMADIYVCPSLEDNLPNTVLEAMACGLPVIGSNAGGIPDMIVHGQTGWIYPAADSHAFRIAIIEALSDVSRARAMGVAGRERAISDFSLQKQAHSYHELYREILSKTVIQ